MSAQLSRHAPSSHRFNFAISLCVIGILATWLLHSLNEAQHDIEKVILETELTNLRLGMAETWVHKNVMNQPVNIEALKDSNPMLLIMEKPANYIGEQRAEEPRSSKAIWYFDTQKKRLIYVFSDGHQARYRLVGTAGKASASLLAIGGLDLVKDVTEP